MGKESRQKKVCVETVAEGDYLPRDAEVFRTQDAGRGAVTVWYLTKERTR